MQSIKTKVLTVFMSFIMAVTMFPALASNADTTYGTANGVTYKLVGNTLQITGKGAMLDFGAYANPGSKYPDYSDAPWYKDRTKIYKVVIGDGITRVGNNSFLWLSSLKEVEFQSKGSLTSIGTQAFYECIQLTSVAIPYGVTSIGTNAFAYNSVLKSVAIPNTVKVIGYGAFANCRVLTSVYIPASVNSIGDFAFRGNYKLRSVTGGAGLTSIGVQAFEFTYDLKTFKITSKKLSRIGKCCFLCSGLKTLQIKKTTKLKKKKVKGSLYLSNVKTVKVKKSKVKKYRKFFTRRNCGKYRVKVKK